MLKKIMFPVLFLMLLVIPAFGAPPIDAGMTKFDAEIFLQQAAIEAGIAIDTKNIVFATQDGHAIATAAIAGVENLQKIDFIGGRDAALIFITAPQGADYYVGSLDELIPGMVTGYYVISLEYIPEDGQGAPEGAIATLRTLTGDIFGRFDVEIDNPIPDPNVEGKGFVLGGAPPPWWWWPRFTFNWAWDWGWRFWSPWWYYWYFSYYPYYPPYYPYYLWWNWHWWIWHFDWHWRWWGWGLHLPYLLYYQPMPTPPPLAAFVNDIGMSYGTNGPEYWGIADINIRDTNGNNVPNANVMGEWTGVAPGLITGVTDATGMVNFQSSPPVPGGDFTMTVIDVIPPTMPYDPGLNVETSDTIFAP